MTTMKSLLITAVAGIAAALASAAGANAQTFPDKPISLIVPFTAGGGGDAVGRRLAELMSQELGQQVIVENKPGAGSMIAAEYVKAAEPDGYTLLLAMSSTLSFAPNAQADARYSVADFTAVSGYITYPFGLAARNGAPFTDMRSLIEYAKENPRKLSFGTTGRGGAVHMMQQMFNHRLGIETVDVPYQGGSPALQDILGERLDVYADGILNLVQHHKEGTIKMIAVSGAERTTALPDVPSFKEAGFPELIVTSWSNVVAPRGTPEPIIERLNQAIKVATGNAELLEWLAASGYDSAYTTPAEEQVRIEQDAAIWKERFEEFDVRIE